MNIFPPLRLFEVHTFEIVQHTLYVLLAEEGVNTKDWSLGYRDPKTKVACENVIATCKRLLENHGDDIRVYVNTLDISPPARYFTYHKVARCLFEDGGDWENLVLLFCISSLKEWLLNFILESHKNWILQHDG